MLESLPLILTNHPIVTNQVVTNPQGLNLYNPKFEFFKFISAPIYSFFKTYNISGLWFAVLLAILFFYFFEYRPFKRDKVKSSAFYSTLLITIFLIIGSIIMQSIMCSQVQQNK
ncbi:MAG: hypothetical protein A2Y33_05770 [Spirochaetes bacterium GWF1_51_8]|nr:MAG: hypothetical protein A2Y33_05770 [Spirochaetes bacterium GWF1_51_8]